MQQRLIWAVNFSSASQEIPRILRDPKVQYRLHYSPSLSPVLNQTNLVHGRVLYFED